MPAKILVKEVIAPLLTAAEAAAETLAGGVNANHVKNPQKTLFLNAKMTDYPSNPSTPAPSGVDQNGVYRDPWGNPYQFLSPGIKGEVDVFSFGSDGQPGGTANDADIGSWEL